jgi:hypothetical protein
MNFWKYLDQTEIAAFFYLLLIVTGLVGIAHAIFGHGCAQ